VGKDEKSSAETQAHNFSGRQKANRGGTKSKVGEDTGGEEVGCLEANVQAAAFAALLCPHHFPTKCQRSQGQD
jgi:hypothetical protein